MPVRVRIVMPDRLSEEEREPYEPLLDIEGRKASAKGAKKGKGFFQDVVDKVKESVK